MCARYDGAMSTLLESLNPFGVGADSLRHEKLVYNAGAFRIVTFHLLDYY